MVAQVHQSSFNRCDKDRRKELYKNLSWYLDRRKVRGRRQTYVFPSSLNDLIREAYPEGVQNYAQVQTTKNRKLTIVKREDKCDAQLSAFCKKL